MNLTTAIWDAIYYKIGQRNSLDYGTGILYSIDSSFIWTYTISSIFGKKAKLTVVLTTFKNYDL
jgi:hypothetical protein